MVAKEKSKKIKLIFFSFGILEQGGGFENYIIQSAADLIGFRNVFETAIVTSTPKATEHLQSLLTVYFFKRHSLKSIYRESHESILRRLGKVKYLRVSTRKELANTLNKYDYIYVKNEILELVILKLIKKKLDTPIIIGVHTAIYYPFTPSLSAKLHNLLYTGRFYKWLLKEASNIKVNNSDDKEYIIQTFGYTKVDVVHHAFKVETNRQQRNTSKLLRVLFVGRLTEAKGVDTLLLIMDKLIKKNLFDQFVFRVVGSGEKALEDQLNAFAQNYKNIELMGHIANEEISLQYDWSDVTVIPSRYETLNKVAVETAIAGKVAISSDIPGPREVIKDKKTGYLIPNDAESFCEKLIELLEKKNSHPTEFYTIGLHAQAKIKSEFSPHNVYTEFYDQLLNRNS